MKISQRQAREYRRRMTEAEATLQRQKGRWASDWSPGWVNIETLQVNETEYAAISTARKLEHAIVLVPSTGNQVLVYAEKL